MGKPGGLTDLTKSADYLADEYLLDLWLRHCSKPVFAWGDGYIMGGGMGVFQGADVRCVTEHSNLAMPEVRIGFVPDCGGSWFLNRVPNGLGVCLAMSGATVGAADGCWLNLADWLLPVKPRNRLCSRPFLAFHSPRKRQHYRRLVRFFIRRHQKHPDKGLGKKTARD